MSIDKHPRLEKDPRPEVWEGWPGTVLPSDEITYYSTSPDISPGMHLIDPFEEEYLEAARYNLRLGSIVHVGGEPKTLDDSNPWLILEPHQSAVVQTFEEVRLPRFLIARWNLKVRMVYEGLLWTGSLQVDPGWHGRLVCPIYNLANRRVYLRYKKDIFAMDFVRTTLYKPGVSKPYEQKGQVSLEDYDIHRLQSAPYSVLGELQSVRSRVDRLNGQIITFAVLLSTLLAVVITAIGLLVAAQSFKLTFSIPIFIAIILSIISLPVSGIALWATLSRSTRSSR